MICVSGHFTYLAMVWSHCSQISKVPLYKPTLSSMAWVTGITWTYMGLPKPWGIATVGAELERTSLMMYTFLLHMTHALTCLSDVSVMLERKVALILIAFCE